MLRACTSLDHVGKNTHKLEHPCPITCFNRMAAESPAGPPPTMQTSYSISSRSSGLDLSMVGCAVANERARGSQTRPARRPGGRLLDSLGSPNPMVVRCLQYKYVDSDCVAWILRMDEWQWSPWQRPADRRGSRGSRTGDV